MSSASPLQNARLLPPQQIPTGLSPFAEKGRVEEFKLRGHVEKAGCLFRLGRLVEIAQTVLAGFPAGFILEDVAPVNRVGPLASHARFLRSSSSSSAAKSFSPFSGGLPMGFSNPARTGMRMLCGAQLRSQPACSTESRAGRRWHSVKK